MRLNSIDGKVVLEEKRGTNWNSRYSYWMDGKRITLNEYNHVIGYLVTSSEWNVSSCRKLIEGDKEVERIEYHKV